LAVPFDFVGNAVSIIQIISLFLLVAGVIPARRTSTNRIVRIIRHGHLSTLALALNFATLFIVMVPSLTTNLPVVEELSTLQWLVVWVHVISGVSAKIMGSVLVGFWLFKPKEKTSCAKRKWLMMPTLAIWIFATIFGLVIHIVGII
jgi:hypothetical protein